MRDTNSDFTTYSSDLTLDLTTSDNTGFFYPVTANCVTGATAITSLTIPADVGYADVYYKQPSGSATLTATDNLRSLVTSGTASLSLSAQGTTGSLDTTFNSTGKLTTDIQGSGSNDTNDSFAVAVQMDGKILVGGSSEYGGTANTEFLLLRYTASGTLDTSFNESGKIEAPIFSGKTAQINAIAIQPDGKVIAAGQVATEGKALVVARYKTDGTVDTSFGTSGLTLYKGAYSGTYSVPSGFVIKDPDSYSCSGVSSGGGGELWANAVTIRPNGKIVVAGYAKFGGADTMFMLAQFNSNGTIDTSFGDVSGSTCGLTTHTLGSSATSEAKALSIDSEGKLVVAGVKNNGSDYDFAVARFTSTGAIDTTFNSTGYRLTDFASESDSANGVSIQTDGKIVAAGNATVAHDRNFGLTRYTSTGALDTSFDSDGKLNTDIGGSTTDLANAIVIQPDGQIIVAGTSDNDFAAVRYSSSNGSLDLSFASTGKKTVDISGSVDVDTANAIALQPDGKLVISGKRSGTDPDIAVIRLWPGGYQ